jgi:hypothetical protein
MDITDQNVEEIRDKFKSMEFQWIKGEYLSGAENYKNVNYDFMTSDLTTYEVKADEMSLNTNNFFIEFKKGNMRTGILTSGATFHIITNTKKYYLIETAELRKLVFQNRIKYKQGITKDNTVGFLVPTCDIIELSEVI